MPSEAQKAPNPLPPHRDPTEAPSSLCPYLLTEGLSESLALSLALGQPEVLLTEDSTALVGQTRSDGGIKNSVAE